MSMNTQREVLCVRACVYQWYRVSCTQFSHLMPARVCVFRLYRDEEHLNKAIDRKKISIRVQYNTKRNIRIKLCSWWNSLKWEFDESKQMLWWHKKICFMKNDKHIKQWNAYSFAENLIDSWIMNWFRFSMNSFTFFVFLLFSFLIQFEIDEMTINFSSINYIYKYTYNRQRGFRHKKYWVRHVCDEP